MFVKLLHIFEIKIIQILKFKMADSIWRFIFQKINKIVEFLRKALPETIFNFWIRISYKKILRVSVLNFGYRIALIFQKKFLKFLSRLSYFKFCNFDFKFEFHVTKKTMCVLSHQCRSNC